MTPKEKNLKMREFDVNNKEVRCDAEVGFRLDREIKVYSTGLFWFKVLIPPETRFRSKTSEP